MTQTMWLEAEPLVLASASASRRQMLEAAGIPLTVMASGLDERAAERAAAPLTPAGAAVLLAREKALAVSARVPASIVMGADQTLALGAERFDKPASPAAARAQLARLKGRTHHLHSAAAVARGGAVLFEVVDTASLTMRDVSPAFLDRYMAAAGEAVCSSVGGYQLEKAGIHLFERIEGDHFTILGLPLIKVLDFLRRSGILAG